MRFRTRMIVSGPSGSSGEQIELAFPGATVTIARGPHPRSPGTEAPMVSAVANDVPPDDVAAYLRSGRPDSAARPARRAERPDAVKYFADSMATRLSKVCTDAVQLLRWRCAADTPHQPLSSLGSDWSEDGLDWFSLPTTTRVQVWTVAGLSLTQEMSVGTQRLVDAATDEPIAHQILREARDVVQANPRSGLVIGVAAVEVGFKQLVAALAPDAAWLVQEIPSPPIVKMLGDYLPTLPVRPRIDDHVYAPPKYVRRLLWQAVEARNRVAHRGTAPLDLDQLKVILGAAQDLLYLFDYYQGNDWALGLVSDHFRTSLGS